MAETQPIDPIEIVVTDPKRIAMRMTEPLWSAWLHGAKRAGHDAGVAGEPLHVYGYYRWHPAITAAYEQGWCEGCAARKAGDGDGEDR